MNTLPDLVITGPPVVGKGTICNELFELGYRSIIDIGQCIREELAELGEDRPEPNRQGEYASQMIRTCGPGHFVDRPLRDLPGPHIIDCPRRAVEIDHLLNLGAVLLFVDADETRRHVWSCVRDNERDGLTFKEFLATDKFEWGYVLDFNGGYRRHNNPYERNLRYALGRAHATFANDGSQADLRDQIRRFVEDLQTGEVGPTSDWGQRAYRVQATCAI
jgi:hypothetical protein